MTFKHTHMHFFSLCRAAHLVCYDNRPQNGFKDVYWPYKQFKVVWKYTHCEHHEISSTVASVTAGKSLGFNGFIFSQRLDWFFGAVFCLSLLSCGLYHFLMNFNPDTNVYPDIAMANNHNSLYWSYYVRVYMHATPGEVLIVASKYSCLPK